MLRPLLEAGKKINGEQVEKSLHDTRHAVLRAAKLASPVVHDNFADLPAAGRRQDGHEPVQFAIQPHFVEDLAAVALEAAVVIVQADAGEHADEPVEYAR